VAFGEQRDRYLKAADLQKYAGIAPVTEHSGKKHWVHWRWQCPTFLRQTFTEWASQTINKPFWAGQYYRQQRAKGCTIKLRYALWRSSGSASFYGVGKQANLIMNQPI